MSDQVVHSEVQPFSARAALPWLVGLGVYVLLLILGPRLLSDPDSYSHIEVGRWIIAHGSLPASDPYSFSMHGAPWITFEWLSEIIYAGAYALAGWPGVVVLAAAAIALAFGLFTFFLVRELSPVQTLLMVIAAVILLAPHMLARPHVLVLPVMVTWAAALVRCMDREGPPPYWALPLLVVWANLHGSVVLALGLIGPAGLEALLREKRSEMAARVPAVATIHGARRRSVLPDAVRAGTAADAADDTRPRPRARLDLGMAAAGFQPRRFLRVAAAGRHPCALARRDAAGRAGLGRDRVASFRAGAGPQCGSAGLAGAALSGGSAGAKVRRVDRARCGRLVARREPGRARCVDRGERSGAGA
ncbi:hypothetical protein ACVWW2_003591 [Bradyrhizobium sp. LM4.3]